MLSAVFLRIVNMSFTASLVILAVLILRLGLKKAPKFWSYILWSVVLLRLLLPFSFELPTSQVPTGELIAPRMLTESEPTLQISSGVPIIDEPVNDFLTENYFEGVTVPVGTKLAAADIAAICWLIGVVIIAGAAAISLFKLRRRLKSAVNLRDNIYQTDEVAMPFVLGVLRPHIYLPASLAEAEQPYILLHEQCHIRRGDHLIKLLAFAALTLHWFNPLIWLAYRLAMLDMEMSCDESVLAGLEPHIRLDYSESLLRLSGRRAMRPLSPLAFGESDPARRIKNLLNYKKPALWLTIGAAVIVIVAAVLLIGNKPGGAPIAGESINLNGLIAEQIAELHDGETIDITPTPELREAFYDLGRAEFWWYLPTFSEAAPPQTPDAYLLQMFMRQPYESWPQAINPALGNEYPYISEEELDKYASAHFGVGGFVHSNDYYLKPFHYADGKYFADPFDYYLSDYELTGLTVFKANGRITYAARLNEYDFGTMIEYEGFCRVQGLSDEEYQQYYDRVRLLSEQSVPAEIAVLDKYGKDIQSGKMTKIEAVRQMIIDGDTASFEQLGHGNIFLKFSLPEDALDFGEVLYLENTGEHIEASPETKQADAVQDIINDYMANIAGEYSQYYDIFDSEVTTLEKLPGNFAMGGYRQMAVYKIAYRFRTDDERAGHSVDGVWENGWLSFPVGMEDYLAIASNDKETWLVTRLAPEERLQYTDDTRGVEAALRAKLERIQKITGPTYDSDHQIAEFNLSSGESCKLLLSQPATKGAKGIWCVERWQDGSGNVYLKYPAGEDDKTAAEYYAALQRECDNGHQPGLLDWDQVARQFIQDELNRQPYDLHYIDIAPAQQGFAAYMLFREEPVSRFFGEVQDFSYDADSPMIRFSTDKCLTPEENREELIALGLNPEDYRGGVCVIRQPGSGYTAGMAENCRFTFERNGSPYTTENRAEFAAYLDEWAAKNDKPSFFFSIRGGELFAVEESTLNAIEIEG